ncbi:MAG TPA: MBL fold metallo-hydrolase [Bryobacteraceae bacterium]|nr:MBL fold metallo-hydrolase [Bryobacteraceae bacterium]
MSRQRTLALIFAGLSAGAPGLMAQGGRGPARPDPVEKARMLKPDLYLITGGGANTVVRVTPEGLIVVDTKNPGGDRSAKLMEEIKAVSTLPVKYVFNTHHHPDHVGNNQALLDAGATIIDAAALKKYMASDPRTKDIPGLANQTFDHDYVLKFGGAEVDAYTFGRGHTGDDTMIYFPDKKVVMVSDQITDGSPIADYANGGSFLEWNKSLDGVLKLDFETAIPGRGEPKTREEVEAFRTKMATLVSRAQDAVKAGATKENFASMLKTDDLGWKINPNFLGGLYDEVGGK